LGNPSFCTSRTRSCKKKPNKQINETVLFYNISSNWNKSYDKVISDADDLGWGGVGEQREEDQHTLFTCLFLMVQLVINYYKVFPFFFPSFLAFTFILTKVLFMISPLRMLQHSEICEFEIHWENAPLYYTLVLKEKKMDIP